MLSMVLLALGVPVWLFMRPVVVPIVLTAIAVTLYLLVFNFFPMPAPRLSRRAGRTMW